MGVIKMGEVDGGVTTAAAFESVLDDATTLSDADETTDTEMLDGADGRVAVVVDDFGGRTAMDA